MLTQLSTLKSRLNISETDTPYDPLLTNAILAVSARFDQETHRTLARTVDSQQEFEATSTEVLAACYPVESVSTFETKENETDGWVEQINIQFLIRRACVISLADPLSSLHSALCVARVTYTGGYVLPGATPGPGQTALPPDIEQAAVEQAAAWFLNRDHLGLKTIWIHDGDYLQFPQGDLLPEVVSVLARHRRCLL